MNKKSITGLTILLSIFVVGMCIGAIEAKSQKEVIPGKSYHDIGSSYSGKVIMNFYDKDGKELNHLKVDQHFAKDKEIDLNAKKDHGAASYTMYCGAYWDGKAEKLVCAKMSIDNANLVNYHGWLGSSAHIKFKFQDGSSGQIDI